MESNVTAKNKGKQVLWFQKCFGQWCKRINGRIHYFGSDYEQAIKNHRAFLEPDSVEENNPPDIRDYMNKFLIERKALLSFDERYKLYWECRRHIEYDRDSLEESIKIWESTIDQKLAEWDMSRRVYVISAGEHIKIGMATDVKKRIRVLQTSSPFEIEVIVDLPGGWGHERDLHEEFSESRVRRKAEWFVFSDEIRTWLQKINMLKA